MNNQDLDAMMDAALSLPDSPRKVELLEEAVRTADAHYDQLTAMHVRLQLLDAATFGGKIERSVIAFGWILNYFDENPGCLDIHTLLWRYKWIVANVVGFSTVSKEKIYEMENDMERRFLQHGFSLQVVHEKRFENAKSMGDRQRAKEYFQKWLAAERDSLSDCLACDQNHRVEALSYFGDYQEAFEVAKPLLERRMTCRTMPQVTYASLLLPAMKIKNSSQADQLFSEGYHQIRGKDNFLRQAANHLYYLVWANRLEEALDCFWQHLKIANNMMVDSHKIVFYHASNCLFTALGDTTVDIRVPNLLPGTFSDLHPIRASELAEWSGAVVKNLADAFDLRNENSYWTDDLNTTTELVLQT